MFFSKELDKKIDRWGDKGMIGKLEAVVMENDDQIMRARAYKAMGKIRDRSSVDLLINCFRLDETEMVRKAAAEALGMIATRKEFDRIQHVINNEPNEEIKAILQASAVEAKEKAARW